MIRVDCWVYPLSGFELALSNKIQKECIESGEFPTRGIPEGLEGYVLKSFYFESRIADESILVTAIKKRHPEAVFSDWEFQSTVD